MKFFTPELIARVGSLDDVDADAADAEWEDAVDRHHEQLQALQPQLPASFWYLVNHFFLHDADVLGMGWQGEVFVIVLRLDVPPHELLVLNYQLVTEPFISTEALPLEARCNYMQWMYDEIGFVPGENSYATHSILFSNGWEVRLCLRDLQVIVTQTRFPVFPTSAAPVQQPAVQG